MARKKIFARSPYYITLKTTQSLASVKLNLWIYEGHIVTDMPIIQTYTLQKETSVSLNGNNWFTFEIAELVKDYLPKVLDPRAYGSTAMWVATEIEITFANGSTATSSKESFAALDGYLKYEEGSQSINYTYTSSFSSTFDNPISSYISTESSTNPNVPMLTDVDKYSTFIPVFVDDTESAKIIKFDGKNNGTQIVTLNPSSQSADIIQYALASYSWIDTQNGVQYSYITAGDYIKFYDEVGCIPDFTNNSTGTRIWFINRYGAIDKIAMFGLKSISYSTTKNEYRANSVGIKSNGNWGYDLHTRQKSILNKKASKKFTLNTGWIDENYNDTIQDLLLAEQVWVGEANILSDVLPINISTSTIDTKTNAEEKLINYSIDFDYANDIQNNIR